MDLLLASDDVIGIDRPFERGRRATWNGVFSSTWMLPAILVLTVLFYAPTLNQWFFGDDFHFLRRSQTIGWGTWFTQTWDFRDPRPVPEFPPYRPLYLLTFRAEYTLFGLHSFGYHVVNLVAHLLAVTLVWLIAVRLTQRRLAAHLAALIFALHPGYTPTITWISNGNAVMATVFYLLAFLLFMKHTDGGRGGGASYAAFLLSFTLALLYHPVTTPLIAALFAWYFLVRRRPADALRWRSWIPFVPIAAIVLPFLAIERWVRAQDLNETIAVNATWHMLHVYRDYLAFAIYPSMHAAAAPFHGVAAPAASGTVIVMSALLLTQWRWPAVPIIAVIWFYTSMLPESAFVFGAQPRLFYLPGASLAILLAVAAVHASHVVSHVSIRLPRVRAPHGLYAVTGVAAIIIAASLMRARDPSWLPSSGEFLRAASTNEQFLRQLRREDPELPQGGTLYVVNPPLFLIIVGTDYNLASLVQIYYGDVHVKVVPLKQPLFWNEQQVRASLGPTDRIIVFDPIAPAP